MQYPDLINAVFEFCGGFVIFFLHCRKLYKDKKVRGVSVPAIIFFNCWGLWNLFYYPHLEQWASLFGTIFIVASNTIWIIMMIYYISKEKRENFI